MFRLILKELFIWGGQTIDQLGAGFDTVKATCAEAEQ